MKYLLAISIPLLSLSVSGCGGGDAGNGIDAAGATGDGGGGGGEVDAASAMPSAGCQMPATPGVAQLMIDVDGAQRSFVLVVPDGYDADVAMPLVFGWHGAGGNGVILRAYTGVESEARGSAVFVYPDGRVVQSTGTTGWELQDGSDDMKFYDALYEQVLGELCIDTKRVFSYGHSFGGYMSNSVACYRSETTRAIGVVAGGGPAGTCGAPVSAWISHARNDPTVPFSQGEGTLNRWFGIDGCSAETSPVDPEPCVQYAGCSSGARLHWCATDTGAHNWPAYGGAGVWSFFASF